MPKIYIDWFLVDVWPTFHGLKEFARIMEKQIEQLTETERLRIRKTAFPDETEWQREWNMHDWLFEEILPRTLRYSCIVSLLTALETTMNGMCDELHKRRDLPISPRDLKGNFLKRTLIYTEKIAGVNIPPHPFKQNIENLIKLRNCIVHAAGHIEDSQEPEEIKRIVSKIDGLGISNDGYLEIGNGTCESLVGQTYNWIDNLLSVSGFGPKEPVVEE